MAVPDFLATDPATSPTPNLLSRTRPGWAPRPNRTVKIRSAWEVPGMELGTGQEEEPDPAQQAAQGISVQEYLNRIGGWATAAPVSPETLTSAPVSDTTAEEPGEQSIASVREPPPAAPAADHAPRATGGNTAARTAQPQAKVNQSAAPRVAPPPQGPSSAARATPAQTQSQQDFEAMAIPAAQKVQERTGIPWQAIVAVSANETGWGKAVAGNNYFGIKGSNPDTGANTGQVGTWEVQNGQRVNIQDTFRAYNGYQDSANDFARFLQTNARYAPAMRYLNLHPSDWRGFLRMVHDAGYATDPNWSDQVIRIGNGLDGVQEADPTRPSMLGMDQNTQRVGITGLLDKASTALGSKYNWGGAGGRSNFDPQFVGSDCSGFVAWAYEQATGMRLPAQTSSMFQRTSNVRPDNAMPGDLVFYNMGEGAHMEHVGIYAGNGMMIHDSSINPNGGVDVTPLWQGAQFRRVDGVDPTLYSRAQGGGMRSQPGDQPTGEYAVVAEHGREIAYIYLSDGTVRKDDMGKASQPDGALISSSEGVPHMGMGSGQEPDPDLTRHLGGASLSDLMQ